MFLLQDKDSGLYVGSHSSRHAQLQERKRAFEFKDMREVEKSLELMERLPVQWRMVEESPEIGA